MNNRLSAISSKMDESILEIYKYDSIENIGKLTLNALRKRGVIGVDNKLTNTGRQHLISRLPLAKQCSALSLDYETIKLSYNGRPETVLLSYYQSLGYIGINSVRNTNIDCA